MTACPLGYQPAIGTYLLALQACADPTTSSCGRVLIHSSTLYSKRLHLSDLSLLEVCTQYLDLAHLLLKRASLHWLEPFMSHSPLGTYLLALQACIDPTTSSCGHVLVDPLQYLLCSETAPASLFFSVFSKTFACLRCAPNSGIGHTCYSSRPRPMEEPPLRLVRKGH